MRKSQELSVQDRRAGKKEKHTQKQNIDFSDIPELTKAQLSVMKRVGRPPLGTSPRKSVSIRLDPKILDDVKKAAAKRGMPYQSLINDILGRAVKNAG